MSIKGEKKTEPHRLPTNTTTRHHPVHRWLNFVAGFSPEFVKSAIDEAQLSEGHSLLDPFCGMATALVVANSNGLNSFGYEPHPFFFDVAVAKTGTRSMDSIDVVESILANVALVDDIEDVWSSDARRFLDKLFDYSSLSWLAGALDSEKLCPLEVRPLYRLVVTRILEGASGGKTDGIYKAPTTSKRRLDVVDTSKRVVAQIREDLDCLPQNAGKAMIYPRSAENMTELPDDSVDICVTSPPYLNNFDFAEMTRMELYFWRYAGSWREITDRVRSFLVINTTTAPAAQRKQQEIWQEMVPQDLWNDLMDLRTALAVERKERAGKKEYDTLVFPYFGQMSKILSETHRVLKPGASIHMVVSDAALYGIHIPTERLLARVMDSIGLEVNEIVRLRNRGGRWVLAKRQGSAEGLGEFHIHAVKKSKV